MISFEHEMSVEQAGDWRDKNKKGSLITANNRDCNYIVPFFLLSFLCFSVVSRIEKNKGISLPHVVHGRFFFCLIKRVEIKNPSFVIAGNHEMLDQG